MKKMMLVMACLVFLAASSTPAQAQDQMSMNDYRVKEWRQIWDHPDYWEDVWRPGYFTYGANWVTRPRCRDQQYAYMKYWKRRYYINYRIMQHTMFDPYDQTWLTKPVTEFPAEDGYVFPATYGRAFVTNITNIWEIKPN